MGPLAKAQGFNHVDTTPTVGTVGKFLKVSKNQRIVHIGRQINRPPSPHFFVLSDNPSEEYLITFLIQLKLNLLRSWGVGSMLVTLA